MDAGAEPVIRVHGLVNRFGRQIVHDGLDMQVAAGEIFGIVGGSGTGKTVLLRTILGLQRPEAGAVELFGRAVGELSRVEHTDLVQRFGVTFQNGALISSLTVAGNVQLPLREYRRVSNEALDEQSDLCVAMVGLPAEAAGKYPAQLSGGMTKRAALARALALEPALLFLDEPTSGLDPISAAAFDELLLYLHSQLGLTVVMITHDLDTLLRTCDRIGVILDGRMVSGTPAQIAAQPHPWIQAYFHGPRARAAAGGRDG
ncbi:MAG TPA: ATP-binding cassette domain-containing protein [Steroidobacteraceae bacterium]|nr:ATP-binding cassette domain-containing protein [Steroidobacteraceae bacterium]